MTTKPNKSQDKEVRYTGLTGIRLRESAAGESEKNYIECDIVTIVAGRGNSQDSVLYPAEVLKNSVGLYNGVPIYMDHPTSREEWDQPERSFESKIGFIREARWDAAAESVAATARFFDPPTVAKLRALREAGGLDHAAMSIRAIAMGREDGDDVVVTTMLKILSVDLVTAAGAGGVIRTVESASGREGARVSTAPLFGKSEVQITKKVQETNPKGRSTMTPEEIAAMRQEMAEMKLALQEAQKGNTTLAADNAALKLKTDLGEVVALAESTLPKTAADAVRGTILKAASKETAMIVYESAKAVAGTIKADDKTKDEAGNRVLNLGESTAGKGIPAADAAEAAKLADDARFIQESRRARCQALGVNPESDQGKAYLAVG